MVVDKKDFNEEEDDFEFGTNKKGDDDKSIEKETDNDKSDDDKKDDDKSEDDKSDDNKNDKSGDDDKKDEDKSDDDSDNSENDLDDDDKSDDDKDGDKGDDKKDDESDDDLFSDKKETEAGKKRTLKEIGKKFDLDLEKDDDDEEFETKLADKLSKSRQEINLDGYSDDAKALIKHLNDNEGDVESFFTNKNIIGLQSVLSLDAETKVRNVRFNELVESGQSKTEAKETVDKEIDEMSTREIKDEAEGIDKQASKLIQSEVKKMVGDRELKVIADKQKKEEQFLVERANLKKHITKKDNFLGLKLSEDAKKSIFRDIDSGEFDKIVDQNPEERKFSAYMLQKHGSKILNKFKGDLSEANRAGHNSATKKSVDALHKTDSGVDNKKSGHDTGRKKAESSKVSFSSDDID